MSGLGTQLHKAATAAILAMGAFVFSQPAAAQELWSGYFVDNIETKAVAGTGSDAQGDHPCWATPAATTVGQ